MKSKLLNQISSNDLEHFKANITILDKEGYSNRSGLPLYNVWIASTEWERGMRVINVYDDKTILFASKLKK